MGNELIYSYRLRVFSRTKKMNIDRQEFKKNNLIII